MFARTLIRRHARDEGEKPFWISFSDLMTACMTVFLIVMAVTVVTMKDEIARIEKLTAITRDRQAEIQRFADALRLASERRYPNVGVDIIKDTVKIDFGADVNFMSGSSEITDAGSRFLRGYLPILLGAAETPLGKKWLKRVVVEGFTDTDGSYLFYLDLSLERSRKVVCALFSPPSSGEAAMTRHELEQMRDLFLVGGYSFNSMLPSKARSRRIELKLEFWQAGEKAQADRKPKPNLDNKPFGHC
ncbi:MAG: hypothetical protein KGQ70_05015 [Alphaproteobacteria bacterium]|nr:hypothetical protein [Alphaproteobacteria bacterium]